MNENAAAVETISDKSKTVAQRNNLQNESDCNIILSCKAVALDLLLKNKKCTLQIELIGRYD